MHIAIMQPYVFPYIGYFQLIKAADVFVVYDDAQWIQQGWINRNRILVQGNAVYFTFPVEKGNLHDVINQKRFAPEIERAKRKILAQIEQNYRRSKQFELVMPLVRRCIDFVGDRVLSFAVNSLQEFCAYLNIQTPFRLSSSLGRDELSGQERVLEINRLLEASRYINPIGGVDLYDSTRFHEAGIDLKFLKARPVEYSQPGTSEFVPFLSIIDVAMNNPIDRIREMLFEYDLVN